MTISHTEIISPPQSVSIMPDTLVALFNCTAIATFINWKINDTQAPVDQFTSEQFQEQVSLVVNATQSLILETLRVLGLLENN